MKAIINQRGSALIITMLIVAAISAAAFGISRIFLADVRLAGSLEDSMKAYYLAEAGIEEGLLRYRVNPNDTALNSVTSPLSRSLGYGMTTTFLTPGPPYVVDTNIEADQAENQDFFPSGKVKSDQTVEIATPGEAGNVEIQWDWVGGVPADCGVEITSVLGTAVNDIFFDKVLILAPTENATVVDTGDRQAIRLKPLCGDLNSVTFTAQNGPIGRTVQTVDSTGATGRAKRRIQATLNRRSGTIVGFFDYVIGCGIEETDCPILEQQP